MWSKTFTVCLHKDTESVSEVEFVPGWCVVCESFLKGDFSKDALCSPSAIRRYWLYVSRTAHANISRPVKPFMINSVDEADLNHDLNAKADEAWGDALLAEVGKPARKRFKLGKTVWGVVDSDGVRAEIVDSARRETLGWAEGFLLVP